MNIDDIILSKPGMIPIGLSHRTGLISWHDFGQYHIYEGSYRRALASHRKIMEIKPQNKVQQNEEPLKSKLADIANIDMNVRAPDLLIFHVSRCGSTLMTKSLAQCRRNNVVGEPGLIFPAIHYLKQRNASNETIILSLRKLISILGRQRVDSHENFVLKLSSHEISALPLLRKIYPSTKMLFLFRHPVEVLVSNLEKMAPFVIERVDPWHEKPFRKNELISNDEFVAEHIANCMDEALTAADDLVILDYKNLRAENFKSIIQMLEMSFSDEEMRVMHRQFGQYSKTDLKKKGFSPDGERKQKTASDNVWRLHHNKLQRRYSQLCNASKSMPVLVQ